MVCRVSFSFFSLPFFTETDAYRSMLHDPVFCPNPSKFKPERFLKADGTLNPDTKDPGHSPSGSGAASVLGYSSAIPLCTASSPVLSVYGLLPPLDQEGNVIKVKPEWTTGLVQCPLPFKCRIKPRSKAAERLIKHSRDHYA